MWDASHALGVDPCHQIIVRSLKDSAADASTQLLADLSLDDGVLLLHMFGGLDEETDQRGIRSSKCAVNLQTYLMKPRMNSVRHSAEE